MASIDFKILHVLNVIGPANGLDLERHMWPSPYEYMDRFKAEYKGGFGGKMAERDTRMLVAPSPQQAPASPFSAWLSPSRILPAKGC